MMNSAIKVLCMIAFFIAITYESVHAQSSLSTLSTGKDSQLIEQLVTISKRKGRLELGIDWKKTNPVTFSESNKGVYVDFFNSLILQWDTYANKTIDANRNTFDLGELATHHGEISAFFFRNLADGRSFPDKQPRLRLVYCKRSDKGCLRGQVHFYSKEQVVALRDIITKDF